ncbi:GNAT family N-acetyltransferase [Algoriphagus algorifonticola]|uniref:GNAT family N-acetyltransferase n=1 Tax=Algoriphagus algorifonticola TaxID=2593007 RepID=UPI00119FF5C9|nr:GNAT family N-acetyltransferase [Algoriphagus algorifonticola]
MVSYQIEKIVSLEEFIAVLNSSGLAERRPMDQPNVLHKMLIGSNLIVTARESGKLVGILRALTDFSYRCFIADLAVNKAHQNQGVGKKLIQLARSTSADARLFLFAAEGAVTFYEKLGFQLHDHCYQLRPEDDLS